MLECSHDDMKLILYLVRKGLFASRNHQHLNLHAVLFQKHISDKKKRCVSIVDSAQRSKNIQTHGKCTAHTETRKICYEPSHSPQYTLHITLNRTFHLFSF